MNDFKMIKPEGAQGLINKFCYIIGNIPTSYKLGLTIEEQILSIGRYLEEVIYPALNNNADALVELQSLFIQLKNYVDDYFEDLDIQEEVNQKLDEMVEDGSLADLLNQTIFNELNEKVNNKKDKNFPVSNLNYIKKGRIIDKTFYADSTIQGYYGMQGGCLVDENTFVFATLNRDSENNLTDNVLLRKINLTTGDVLFQKVVELGHCNSIAYDKILNRYYVTPAHSNISGNNYFTNKVIILDNEFNVIQTITTSVNFDSISITDNGTLYCGRTNKAYETQPHTIFEVSKDDFSIIDTIELDVPSLWETSEIGGIANDFCVYDDRIYYLQHNPNTIFVFDLEGNCVLVYNLKNTKTQFIGEPENISSFGDGRMLIGSLFINNGDLFNFEQFFECNIETNVSDYGRTLDSYFEGQHINNEITLEVDINSTSFNPDGTASKPFYCIDEILPFDVENSIVIHLASNTTNLISRINSFKGEIMADSGTTTSIECGLNDNKLLIRNSNIYFNTINICPIYVDKNSNIDIYRCVIKPTTFESLIYVNKNSKVLLENCTFDVTENLTNYLFDNNHGELVWGKNNQEPSTFANITKFFNGTISCLVPISFYGGTLTKGNDLTINNGNISCFKQILVRFNDYQEIILPARNQQFAKSFNVVGSSTSKFKQIMARLQSGVLNIISAYQLSLNVSNNTFTYEDAEASIRNVYVL